jgi:hypothetical protein
MTNTCDCENPPGGTISCPDDQLAVCIVKDGAVHGSCHTPPTTLTTALRQVNWALGIVIGIPRLLNQPITPADQRILIDKRVARPDGSVANFRLPTSLGPGGLPFGGGLSPQNLGGPPGRLARRLRN